MRGQVVKNETPTTITTTVLAAGTRAVGELESNEDLVLCGSFKGRLRVQRALRVMPEAYAEGDLQAESVLVMGRVEGTVQAATRVEIRPGAVVSGEVFTPQIRVHEGVILNAQVRMSAPVAGMGVGVQPTRSVQAAPAGTAVPVAGGPAVQAAATPALSPTPPAAAIAPSAPAAPVAPAVSGAAADVNVSGAPPGPARHYLLPALLKTYDSVPLADVESAERAAEDLLRPLGFELETRSQRPDKRGILRPIFRSAEALPYGKLRERMDRVASVLRSVATPAAEEADDAPLQTTGGARDLALALGRLRRVALVVGPVALTRFEENPGARHMAVYVRRDSLPDEAPDPGQLLVALQKVQQELLAELGPPQT